MMVKAMLTIEKLSADDAAWIKADDNSRIGDSRMIFSYTLVI
jgi:hypothetical protein